MSRRCIFASQNVRDLIVHQLDVGRPVIFEDWQAHRPLDRRRVNVRLRAHGDDDQCPFGKFHRPFEHDNAVLNSPWNLHAVIIIRPTSGINCACKRRLKKR